MKKNGFFRKVMTTLLVMTLMLGTVSINAKAAEAPRVKILMHDGIFTKDGESEPQTGIRVSSAQAVPLRFSSSRGGIICYNGVDHNIGSNEVTLLEGDYTFSYVNGKYNVTGPDLEKILFFLPALRPGIEACGTTLFFDEQYVIGSTIPAGYRVLASYGGVSMTDVYLNGSLMTGSILTLPSAVKVTSITGDRSGSTVCLTSVDDDNSSERIEEKYYLDTIFEQLEKMVAEQTTGEVYWEGGDSLPTYIMTLINKGKFDFVFAFNYEGVDHVVRIPSGKAPEPDIEIPWYGPLWLLEHYGDELNK